MKDFHTAHIAIDDYAKDGGDELLPRCIAFELRILNDSAGIRLKNAVHHGKNKKFLAAIFSVSSIEPDARQPAAFQKR